MYPRHYDVIKFESVRMVSILGTMTSLGLSLFRYSECPGYQDVVRFESVQSVSIRSTKGSLGLSLFG